MSALTFTIITANESIENSDKSNAQALTRVLSDAQVCFQIKVSVGNKEWLFSGVNAWAKVKELTG